MNFLTRTLAIGMVLAAGVAFAQDEPTNEAVKARVELMKMNGGAAKVLGDMAGDKVPFDAAAAEAAKAMLIDDASKIPAVFEANETDPASDAKPEIWTNWDDFVAKADALKVASEAMDASTIEGVKAGMEGIGGACGACHKAYKAAS